MLTKDIAHSKNRSGWGKKGVDGEPQGQQEEQRVDQSGFSDPTTNYNHGSDLFLFVCSCFSLLSPQLNKATLSITHTRTIFPPSPVLNLLKMMISVAKCSNSFSHTTFWSFPSSKSCVISLQILLLRTAGAGGVPLDRQLSDDATMRPQIMQIRPARVINAHHKTSGDGKGEKRRREEKRNDKRGGEH